MDFPRGKLPPGSGTIRRKRKAPADVLFKKIDTHDHDQDGEKKKSKRKKIKKSGDGVEEEGKVVIEAVSMKRLPIGTSVIGCISKITDFELTMTIAGGGIISVPIYNISDSYSELVETFVSDPSTTTPFKPQSMFEVGQCLPVKILEKSEEGKRKMIKIIGSINPKDVYSEIHPLGLKSFASNIVISAAVTGIEDHGYIMDIGLGNQLTGFLSAADAKEFLKRRPEMNRIPVGCVLLCAGVSISSRVLQLSTKRDLLNNNVVNGDSDVIPIASVVPGLKVLVRVMDICDRGLEIIVANEHKGYIHRDHLKSEWDVPDKNYSIATVMEARVLFVHPVSQYVVCTLRELPDPISIEKKFSSLNQGKVIPDAKVALFDERGNMILMTKKDQIKLLAIKTNISDEPIDDTTIIQDYPVGSKQKCKVLSINYFDQLLRVTLKPSYVNEECITEEDISVGSILTGKVQNLTKSGMYLKLGPRITAFARNFHFADAPQVVHPEKMFPLDKEVKCRVMKIDRDVEPSKIIVTCKKSLISSKLDILDSMEKAIPGFETLGVVVLANKNGVLLEFFAGLQGWISRILLSDYTSIESSFLPGQIVKCYVISSDLSSGRINLSLNKSETSGSQEENVIKISSKKPEAVEKKKDDELGVGEIVTGKVTGIGDDGLVVGLTGISTTIPLTQIIDPQYINKRELERRYKVGDEVKCRVVSRSHDELVLTMKPSLLDPSIEVWRNLPVLQVGMTSLGSISKVLVKQARLVTFIGGVRGSISEKLVQKNDAGYKAGRLQPGELVACQIINVDPAAKKLSLDLVALDTFMSQKAPPEKPVTSGFSFNKSTVDSQQVDDNDEYVMNDSFTADVKEKKVKAIGEKTAKLKKSSEVKESKPETIKEYESKVVAEPDSCVAWLEYMSYLLECNQVNKAREVGERALKTINFREDGERFNIWVALINLEHFYGDQDSLEKIIERARNVNDSIKIDLRIAKMHLEADETEMAEQIYASMMKKSKHDKNYWVEYGMFFMKLKRFEAARSLMKKCLDSLPNRDHLDVISKFAQMKFKAGQIEQGKTLFENILANYPKRTDVWVVYLSMLIKYSINHELPSSDELESVRTVFERALTMGINAKKVGGIFKKYIEFEKSYGNEVTVNAVKDKSLTYVESNKLQPCME